MLALACGLAACERPAVPSGWPPGAAPFVEEPALDAPGAKPGEFVRGNNATPAQPATTCNIELIDGKPFADAGSPVAAGAEFVVSGYAIDTEHERVPGELRLRAVAADGAMFEAPLRTGQERPDVPVYFRIGGWARLSGYKAKLSSAGLPAGEYRLHLAFADGSTLYACDNGRRLRVDR